MTPITVLCRMWCIRVFILGTLAAVVLGQVNSCGQVCISNALALAPSLGCPGTPSPDCLCKNVNFGYSLRDCAAQSCGSAQEAAVVAYITSYCAGALSSLASSSSSSQNSISSVISNVVANPSSTAAASIAATVTTTGNTTSNTPNNQAPSSTGSALGSSSSPLLPSAISTGSVLTSTGSSLSSSTPIASPITSPIFTTASTSSSTIATTQPVSASSRQGGGLSGGAIAGITIGVVTGAITAILLALFCYRRRKSQSSGRKTQELETADPPTAMSGHEMITSANTHELNAKSAADFQVQHVEPDRQERPQELETRSSVPSHEKMIAEGLNEMGIANDLQSTKLGSNSLRVQPSELEGIRTKEKIAEQQLSTENLKSISAHSAAASLPLTNPSHTEELRDKDQSEQGAASVTAVPSTLPDGPGLQEERLAVLRKRMERVRDDKERLEKIQALKDLEAELQAEILAEQRKVSGL